jgi:hypothetical protein
MGSLYLLPEEFPVDPLLGRAGPPHEHNRSNLAVCRADGDTDLRGQQNCECSAYLYCEPSESRNVIIKDLSFSWQWL